MFENLQKDHGVQHLLQKVGEYLELSDDVRDDMRWFVLLKVYGERDLLAQKQELKNGEK